MYTTPTEWKSENWWRNRSTDERLFHLRIPSRVMQESTRLAEAGEFAAVHGFVDNWKPGGNLFIQGHSGKGKSVMAAYLLGCIVSKHKVSGRWIEADDYIEMIKDSFDSDGVLPEMYSTPHLIKYVKGVFDVLVLDGLGDERLTEFAAHELGSLIRKRFERSKSTIITSRLGMADIKDRYGSRLASPLADFELKNVR
jgi:DNA replication protein DnaC